MRRRLAYMTLLAIASFSTAYIGRSIVSRRQQRAAPVAAVDDSIALARLGVRSGRHLIAYVFVSSDCPFCNMPDVKKSLASVRRLLREHRGSEFSQITVVGVAIDPRLTDGLEYLRQLDLSNFDEIDVGSGWRNEQVVSHMWRGGSTEAAVPQVVLVTRRMNATVSPFSLEFGRDSVLRVVRGGLELLAWINDKAPTTYAVRTILGDETQPVVSTR